MAVIFLLLIAPLIAIGAAFLRATILFWPTMIVLGAAHSYIPMIPSLGWVATFWLIALISLLFPFSTSTSSNK